LPYFPVLSYSIGEREEAKQGSLSPRACRRPWDAGRQYSRLWRTWPSGLLVHASLAFSMLPRVWIVIHRANMPLILPHAPKQPRFAAWRPSHLLDHS
jgi:hypothetical protein